MKTDEATGALVPFDFSGIYEEFPSLKRLKVDIEVLTIKPPIDSSNVSIENWADMARLIRDNYAKYDGFVVLHGTDTMSYTASALSFMLENLSKPVIFTGSQIPMGILRTDGRENLITAIELAAATNEEGKAILGQRLAQGILAEEKRKALCGGDGHGCGHNLLGTGSLGAAIAAKRYLEMTGKPGTVILYGCPGEEGGSGKAFMARDGVFDELDCGKRNFFLFVFIERKNTVVLKKNNAFLSRSVREVNVLLALNLAVRNIVKGSRGMIN